MEESYMHLTNFAINKHHEDFEIDEEGDGGHKRSISSLLSWLKNEGSVQHGSYCFGRPPSHAL